MELAEKDQRGMMRIEHLHALTDDAEFVLRHRAAARAQEPTRTIEQMRQALAGGNIRAVCVYDSQNDPVGFAAWRGHHESWGLNRAQLVILYVLPDAPSDYGPALVKLIFSDLATAPDLDVIEIRMRDDVSGVREAWAERDVAFFSYCRLVRYLGGVPLPVLPLPPRYDLVPWDPSLAPKVERLALKAHQQSIDSVVVPDRSGPALVRRLRELQNGHLAGVGDWYPEVSLVALHKGRVVGYIMLAKSDDTVMIVDHAISPQHRAQGVGRILLLRSLIRCHQERVPTVMADVTRGYEAYNLYAHLGFQPTACGEVGIWWRDGRQKVWLP